MSVVRVRSEEEYKKVVEQAVKENKLVIVVNAEQYKEARIRIGTQDGRYVIVLRE